MDVAAEELANPVVLERFRHDLGPLWARVAPWCHRAHEDPAVLIAALHTTPPCASDVEALLAGWSHYDESRRVILAGTVAFLADPSPGPADSTLVDHERVVEAAVRAILRH